VPSTLKAFRPTSRLRPMYGTGSSGRSRPWASSSIAAAPGPVAMRGAAVQRLGERGDELGLVPRLELIGHEGAVAVADRALGEGADVLRRGAPAAEIHRGGTVLRARQPRHLELAIGPVVGVPGVVEQ